MRRSLQQALTHSAFAIALSALALPAFSQAQPAPRSPHQGPPVARDDAEKNILALLDSADRYLSVPREDGRLLRVLTEAVDAKHVVEIGTSVGYSGLWICLGLSKTGGHLTTFEIDADRYKAAGELFKKAGVSAMVTQVLGDAHAKAPKQVGDKPIDLLFLDADKAGYLDYLEKLLPKVRPGGFVVAHNTTRPTPHPDFIKAITTNPELETLFIDVTDQGMSVSLKKR